jgi:hypothetical protein
VANLLSRSAAFSSELLQCGCLPLLINLLANGTDASNKLAAAQVWEVWEV